LRYRNTLTYLVSVLQSRVTAFRFAFYNLKKQFNCADDVCSVRHIVSIDFNNLVFASVAM